MNPIVIGQPQRGGLATTETLVAGLGLPVTLAWSRRKELEEVVPALLKAGGSTLYVDTDQQALGQAAFSHQLQVMGVPHFILSTVQFEPDLPQVLPLLRMALTVLPPTAVLVEGSLSVLKAISEITSEMELKLPLLVTSKDRTITAKSLARSARWETA